MKQCTKCKEWKELSEFYKDKGNKDGFYSCCKPCHIKTTNKYHYSTDGQKKIKAYLATEESRISHRKASKKYERSEKGKTLVKQKRSSEEFKIRNEHHQRKYNESEKGKQARINYRQRNRDKIKARNAVQIEVRAKRIPRAQTLPCYNCGNQARHYHHHNGYSPEHWLDIIPICLRCHINQHSNQKQPA